MPKLQTKPRSLAKRRGSGKRKLTAMGLLLAVFFVPALLAIGARAFFDQPHWSRSGHESTGLAPAPDAFREAIVQVYAARTWGLRGGVAVHTWFACKRADAPRYQRFEVIGWRMRTGSVVVDDWHAPPDGEWFSNPPTLLAELRGATAQAAIDAIEEAVAAYPYRHEYRTLPGPNSNTFTAFVARRVPALRLNLPPNAVGKDYLPSGIAPAPSGTGWQISLFGLAGVLVALAEGVELQLLGLTAGIQFHPLAIKLPGLGTWPRWRRADRDGKR